MPAAPTLFALNEQAILHFYNGAVSNKSGASLTWTVNEPLAQHRIERQAPDGSWKTGVVTGPGVAAGIVGKLPNNDTAHLRIRSEDDTGNSAWLTLDVVTGDFATALAPPSAPNTLAVGSITSIGATLTWEDTSINEAYFVIEVRHGAEIREVRVPGLFESYVLDLTTIFPVDSVSEEVFTVRIKAIGGEANAIHLPPFSSAWSAEVTFETLAPAVIITSPLVRTAEKGSAFTYTITTNRPCTGWTADSDLGTGGEQLPVALARTDNVIAGTITDPVGTYTIELTATDGATTDTRNLTLHVIASSITILPPLAATAKLGVFFSHILKARRSSPGAAPTFSLANAPAWLSLDADTGDITGTPDVAGVSVMQVTATAGPVGGTATFTLTVPELSITSAEEITVFLGEPFTHQLTATSSSPPVEWELILGALAWLTLGANGLITGTPTALGTFEVDAIATLDDHGDSQTLVISVVPLISIGNGTAELEGWQGIPLLEELHYNGPCSVENWYLSGGPPGVEIGALTCGGEAYEAANRNIAAITGTPTASGFFDATITAHVCCDGTPSLHRFAIRFAINGALFLNWLHEDRTLYDLQFQVRGDILHRSVESWYGRAEKSVEKTSTKITDTTATGLETTVVKDAETPAVAANLLTAKRGDKLRLAILPRDGRQVLLAADGITNVRLILRLPDAADEDYLVDVAGVATAVGSNSYYLVELEVTQELLDDLMAADSVQGEAPSTGPISVLGEIHTTLGGVELSSGTFVVRFVEDVER